jgi:hypothetical protein
MTVIYSNFHKLQSCFFLQEEILGYTVVHSALPVSNMRALQIAGRFHKIQKKRLARIPSVILKRLHVIIIRDIVMFLKAV